MHSFTQADPSASPPWSSRDLQKAPRVFLTALVQKLLSEGSDRSALSLAPAEAPRASRRPQRQHPTQAQRPPLQSAGKWVHREVLEWRPGNAFLESCTRGLVTLPGLQGTAQARPFYQEVPSGALLLFAMKLKSHDIKLTILKYTLQWHLAQC